MTLQTEKLSEDQADQMKKISDIFPNPLLRYRKNGFVNLEKPMGDTGHYSCNVWMLKQF